MTDTLLELKDYSITFRTPEGEVAAVSKMNLKIGRGETRRHRRRIRFRQEPDLPRPDGPARQERPHQRPGAAWTARIS